MTNFETLRKRPLKAISKAKTSCKFRTIVASIPSQVAPTKHSPEQLLQRIMTSKNMDSQFVDSLTTDGFFFDPTNEEINAYGSDVLEAIRSCDMERLRWFQASGRPLKCSNRFGESLLHLACRKGLLNVVSFLVKEANVPVRVRDDYGRTPLHDACWTTNPNFELIELLISECPDLLFMKDKRGHTPLAYARKNLWKEWNEFLWEKKHLISQCPAFLRQ